MIWMTSVIEVAVADRENVLAPNPVKTFLRHAKCDDDVQVFAVLYDPQALENGLTMGAVINEVGDLKNGAVRSADVIEPSCGIPNDAARVAGCKKLE